MIFIMKSKGFLGVLGTGDIHHPLINQLSLPKPFVHASLS
jgi:hypothetical protein